MHSRKFLNDILKRGGSNFDIFRLTAALAVILGHAYAISPQPPLQDGVLTLLHFDYSGSLAVKFFFFLSGLLVTNSILSKPDPFHFLAKRIFRIFPGLLVCLLVAVFIVGPLYTKFSLDEYFSAHQTWSYLYKNFFLNDLQWRLTGVFTESKWGLNGSLWTLPYEAVCYLYLAIFFGLGLLKNKTVSNLFYISIVAVAFIAPGYLPSFFSQNTEACLLPACFAIGALFANNKESININISQVILIWLLAVLLKHSVVYQFIFYIALFYTIIFISSLDFVIHRLKMPFDASYGVYVYGYMIQQCVHASLPNIGVYGNQIISAAIAVILGILSWYLVEKRFIEFGHQLTGIDSLAILKIRARNVLKNTLFSRLSTKKFAGKPIFIFFFLTTLAFMIQAFVLAFIFPGYYSPLYLQTTDFYLPTSYAGSQNSLFDMFSWPYPINMLFASFTGHFGIYGNIGWIIAITCMNCSLSMLLLQRILRLTINGRVVVLFSTYCYLLFSQPYFYTFFAQDGGSQLSYFFLLAGAWLFSLTFKEKIITAGSILFGCCLLAFLTKETYGLAALALALVWLVYYRKTSFLRLMLPGILVGAALVIACAINIYSKPPLYNLHGPAGSPYHINLSFGVALRQLLMYAKEAINAANVAMLLFLGYLFYNNKSSNRKELIYIFIGCALAGIASWIPHAILPNRHFKGYSFNSAYLLYLPLLLIPVLWIGKNVTNGVVIILIALCFFSPFLDGKKYKDNDGALAQENIQRNFQKALEPLMNDLRPSPGPQKILIEGVSFPFHFFTFPQSLRVFPNARYASFDVVDYNPFPAKGDRVDLVKFISPSEAGLTDYQQKWTFDKDGKLVSSMDFVAEKIFSAFADTNKILKIDQENISRLTTTGFYDAENGIRWTNGDVSISLPASFENRDSLIMQMNTYMPPICKGIIPTILLLDAENKIHKSKLTAKKEDVFYYLFILDKNCNIQKINIRSPRIQVPPPDVRELSFPFKSLEIKSL